MRIKEFLIGAAQNTIGNLGAVILLSLTAILIALARSAMTNPAFPHFTYVFLFVAGIFLGSIALVMVSVSVYARILTPHIMAKAGQQISEPKQRLTIRIDSAYCGETGAPPNLTRLLLNVIVDGPPANVNHWVLTLNHGADTWYLDYQAITDGVIFRPAGQDVRQPLLDVQEISKKVPHRGWLMFTREFPKEFREYYIFGATLTLTAYEDDGGKSFAELKPGIWLRRAAISN